MLKKPSIAARQMHPTTPAALAVQGSLRVAMPKNLPDDQGVNGSDYLFTTTACRGVHLPF